MRHGPSIASAVMGVPGAASGTRGSERSAGVRFGVESGGVPLDPPAASREWRARLGAAESVAPNRWRYPWEEVSPHATTIGTYSVVSGGRSDATWGYLYNRMEASNSASGVQGCAINVDTLPAGFALKPIGAGAIVEATWEGIVGGISWCSFSAPNQADGECADTGASVEREADESLLDAILLSTDGEESGAPLLDADGRWLLGSDAAGLPSADLDDLDQVLLDGADGWWLLGADTFMLSARDISGPVGTLLDRVLLDTDGLPLYSTSDRMLLSE